nr:N-acetyltransferase [Roseospira visakhapatnamensis]
MIRETTETDRSTLLGIQRRAFGRDMEAHLTRDLLRDPSAAPRLSLLALDEDRLEGPSALGHILFTAASLDGAPHVTVSVLAPLAVEPDVQRHGIGDALTRAGLARLTQAGVDLVFLVGHPPYYPRFGFQPAGPLGFEAPVPIPPEFADAWMVVALRDGLIGAVSGGVRWAETFHRPEYQGA